MQFFGVPWHRNPRILGPHYPRTSKHCTCSWTVPETCLTVSWWSALALGKPGPPTKLGAVWGWGDNQPIVSPPQPAPAIDLDLGPSRTGLTISDCWSWLKIALDLESVQGWGQLWAQDRASPCPIRRIRLVAAQQWWELDQRDFMLHPKHYASCYAHLDII